MEGNFRPATEIHRLDGSLRMLVWLILLFRAVQQLSENGTLPPTDYFIQIVLFALLSGALLLASLSPVATKLRDTAQHQPVLMAALPLLLLLPYFLVARRDPEFDPSTVLTTGMLLFLPISAAILNTPALRRSDITLGLVTAIVPLIVPLVQTQAIEHVGLRVAAALVPVLLLIFSTAEQKQRLNFLLICAVLSLWFSVMFGALPIYVLLPEQSIGYFETVATVLLLYALATGGWFDRLGLSLRPTLIGFSQFAINLLLLAVIAIPAGLLLGALHFGFAGFDGINAITHLAFLFVFAALPQEILFRGALLSYLKDELRWPVILVIVASALLFGAAYLVPSPISPASLTSGDLVGIDGNSPFISSLPIAIVMVICGVFFARAKLATGNVATSAALHTVVRWIGRLAFNA